VRRCSIGSLKASVLPETYQAISKFDLGCLAGSAILRSARRGRVAFIYRTTGINEVLVSFP
jgi:hypothetical protein